MPLGTTVTTTELALSGGVPTTTGTAFFSGNADNGSGTTAVLCRSIVDFASNFSTLYAGRTATNAALYDAVDVFFREGGQQCYVIRALAGTETSATLALNDAGVHPTVVVTSKFGGVAANNYAVTVAVANSTTFTANTATTSPNLAAISSFANIGPGTPVSGTAIPANTYILSVNVGAGTAVMSANATATNTGTVITPTNFTLNIVDPSGAVLEGHGPYVNTAALYLDTTSTTVNFTQSAGGGFTIMNPATLAQTSLAGGTNGTPTDGNAVTALNNMPPSLGPGTCALPGRTSTTAWTGLLSHAQSNNRWAPLDMADSASVATLTASVATVTTAANASYGAFFTSTCQVPGLTPGTTRTVAASAVVAALRARVATTGNDNQAPAGRNWPLTYVTGFTNEAFNTFAASGVNTLNAAGINVFANRLGTLCLFGFVSPVLATSDPVFWQATAAVERMALVAGSAAIAEQFLFATIDGQGLTLTHFKGQLQGLIADHWASNALYGSAATLAGSVNVDSPINTAATAQAGQLNAQMQVRISPFAQQVTINIQFVPITQAVSLTG